MSPLFLPPAANCVVICKTKRGSPVILDQKFHLNAHFHACKMHINNKQILPLPLMSEMFSVERDENAGDIFFAITNLQRTKGYALEGQ